MNTQSDPKNTLQQDPRETSFVQNPYTLYRQLHMSGEPIFWENYGFWCLPGYAQVNGVLRDRRFARLPPPGHERPAPPVHMRDFDATEKHSLLALEPPEHTRLRKTLNRAFITREVGQMIPDMHKLAIQCIDKVEAQGQCELLEHYATTIPVAIITRLLGVPKEAGAQLIRWSHAMVRVYTLTQTREEEHLANDAAREFQAFLRRIIEQKRQQPADDLISHLLDAKQLEEPLSEDEIISVAILLLNAGHEATVHQLGNAVYTLLTHFPASERHTLLDILSDDQRTDALVVECMRFSAPLHLFTRYAQEPLTLSGGLCLQAGDTVGLLLAAANRCPIRFQNADQFLPAREDGGHISFGAGLHFCVGAPLARLELRVALQVLFKRLPTLKLLDKVHYQDAYHFHGLQSLIVQWEN